MKIKIRIILWNALTSKIEKNGFSLSLRAVVAKFAVLEWRKWFRFSSALIYQQFKFRENFRSKRRKGASRQPKSVFVLRTVTAKFSLFLVIFYKFSA